MMAFALYAAYCGKVYGEWEALLNRISDDFDDMVYGAITAPRNESPEAAEAEPRGGEETAAPVRNAA
ncbi:MAG: hypothetical protein CL610_18940 [Anaerolineaceae bacterium]|nr:hypothetical protein [Anaerolineaceae bacterium]